jgi:hypothetical protein
MDKGSRIIRKKKEHEEIRKRQSTTEKGRIRQTGRRTQLQRERKAKGKEGRN